MSNNENTMLAICIAEDRSSEEIAVKLLAASISKHCPDIKTIITYPPATENFKIYIRQFPNIELRTTAFPGVSGWNVKPQALLSLLAEGYQEVWWIDSDIILSNDFRNNLEGFSSSALLVTEEPSNHAYDRCGERTKSWGLEVGKSLSFSPNSGVIRANIKHISLLEKWKELLESNTYKSSQREPFYTRPLHMRSDQDVLASLLESRDFAWVSVDFFRRGKDIIQYFGPIHYSVKERLHNFLFGLPPFIHSQGLKPWWDSSEIQKIVQGWEFYYKTLMLRISPYNHVAASYNNSFIKDLGWKNTHSFSSILLSVIGLGNPSLTGLPIVFIHSLIYYSKIFIKSCIRNKAISFKFER